MYRRYTQVRGEGMPVSQIKRSRIKTIIILVLAAALAAAVVIAAPAMKYRQTERTITIQRIQKECRDAAATTGNLSRTAGADSEYLLAQIRSNIYSIKTLNETYTEQNGERLVSEDTINALLNSVKGYFDYLRKGSDTGEYQTGLQTALNELEQTLGNLK